MTQQTTPRHRANRNDYLHPPRVMAKNVQSTLLITKNCDIQSGERNHTVIWTGKVWCKESFTLIRNSRDERVAVRSKENSKEYGNSRYKGQPSLPPRSPRPATQGWIWTSLARAEHGTAREQRSHCGPRAIFTEQPKRVNLELRGNKLINGTNVNKKFPSIAEWTNEILHSY